MHCGCLLLEKSSTKTDLLRRRVAIEIERVRAYGNAIIARSRESFAGCRELEDIRQDNLECQESRNMV